MSIVRELISIGLAAAQAVAPIAPAPGPPSSNPTTVVRADGFNLGAKPLNEISKDQANTLRSQCGDRRFEASAEGLIDGEMKRRTMTLCAAPGDSNAQWISKLANAVLWVKAQPGLSDPVKAKLVADLQGEIGQLETVAPARARSSGALSAADALVSTVPPMPLPLPISTMSGATMLALAPPLVARPPLSIRCLVLGERGGGTTCGRLTPDTVFAVHADGNLASPVTLRFMRRGELRAESSVAALRQGQMLRLKLPSQVCVGVAHSSVEIEVMASQLGSGKVSRLADKIGPFNLHC
ncbi:hypothetical protein [Sphingomonas sp.]|uniref:hypothetical protein n=1 Tax=Sphingomonas sp. TaxID=28214 RepID=UPI00286A298B|nr:hypothetical protein [Sphingomonas sp.]